MFSILLFCTLLPACQLDSGGIASGESGVFHPDKDDAVVLYVSPQGDDTADGTEGSPLSSLSEAVKRAVPGCTIYVHGGVYEERVIMRTSGTQQAPIVIMAVSGEEPVLEGGNGEGWSMDTEIGMRLVTDFFETDATLPEFNPDAALFRVEGASHIVIKGLEVKGSPECGIYCCEGSSHITIEDCTIRDCVGPGICFGAEKSGSSYTLSTDIRVMGNRVMNCAQRAREAISLRSVEGFEVASNVVENVIKESIDAKSGCSEGSIHHNHIIKSGHVAVYVDAGYVACPEQKNIDIYANIVEEPYGTGICVASEAGNALRNMRIYNNLIYCHGSENRGNGLKVAKNSGITTGLIKDVYIYNNTVYGCKLQGIYVNYPTIRNIWISNNISVGTTDNIALNSSNGVPYAEVHVVSNLSYRGQCSLPGESLVSKDPLLDADMTLKAASPAIDAASGDYVAEEDITGTIRPPGAADIGAYEYND